MKRVEKGPTFTFQVKTSPSAHDTWMVAEGAAGSGARPPGSVWAQPLTDLKALGKRLLCASVSPSEKWDHSTHLMRLLWD